MEGIDAIVHLAAHAGVIPSIGNPRFDFEVNVLGTLNLLQASVQKGINKFIFASSNAPLGDQEPPMNEDKVPRPLSPYGAGKLAGEGYCSAYHGSYGLKTVSLRFSNVYGPYSTHKGSVVALFIKKAIEGKPLVIYGDGNQTRDFLYVHDLCRAIHLILNPSILTLVFNPESLPRNPKIWGQTFQIATGRETTINIIAQKIKALVEKDTNQKINIVYGDKRKGEIIRNCSDITKARTFFGYSPTYDLDIGLESTWNWFLKNINPINSITL